MAASKRNSRPCRLLPGGARRVRKRASSRINRRRPARMRDVVALGVARDSAGSSTAAPCANRVAKGFARRAESTVTRAPAALSPPEPIGFAPSALKQRKCHSFICYYSTPIAPKSFPHFFSFPFSSIKALIDLIKFIRALYCVKQISQVMFVIVDLNKSASSHFYTSQRLDVQ